MPKMNNALTPYHSSWDDHVMLAAHNARERSVDEYTQLFEAADPGFGFVGVGGGIAGMHHTLIGNRYMSKAA